MDKRKSMLSGGKTVVLVFAIFFALAAYGMSYLQKANNENAWRLAKEGKTSLATITNKRTETSHTNRKDIQSKSTGGTTSYILEYSFPLVDSNEEWQGNDAVSEEEFDSVEIGDQFDVVYWIEDPDIATILQDAYADGAKLANNIARVLWGLTIIMLFILLNRPLRRVFDKGK